MSYVTGWAAPPLAADAWVKGQKRFPLSLAEYRGTWVVVALGARHGDRQDSWPSHGIYPCDMQGCTLARAGGPDDLGRVEGPIPLGPDLAGPPRRA